MNTSMDQLKAAAGWQCQECGRHCRKRGESVEDFIDRIGEEYWVELGQEGDRLCGTGRDRLSAFVLCGMADGNGGHLLLCAVCAMHFIRPHLSAKHQSRRLELKGQMRLPGL